MAKDLEGLRKSRDFWQSQANHDKKQAIYNLALTGASMCLALSGVVVLSAGIPELGAPMILCGTGGTYYFRRDTENEISSAMDMAGKAAVREYEINIAENQDPDDWFRDL